MSPLVGVTMGDPCGIGPEICLKSLAQMDNPGSRFLLFGDPGVFNETRDLLGMDIELIEVDTVRGLSGKSVPVYRTCDFGPIAGRFGKVIAGAGGCALATIETAARVACDGLVQALATAPVSKESLHLAGSELPGHAEIFARRAGVRRVFTMLMHGDFRVVHLSTHVSLAEACAMVKTARIVQAARFAAAALMRMGIAGPSVAVAALNPHGGDNGLFGNEEIDEIAPAVDELRASGVDAHGPVPADIVFPQARCGLWDVVVAMYHDQGHIPIKTASFVYDKSIQRWTSTGGVTLTLGLPFTRTSVDHGTAFDIAGTGNACEDAMKAAMETAERMAVSGCGISLPGAREE